jgi:hypothetical protein
MPPEAAEAAEATVTPDPRSAPRQPYPGLRPFDENEQRLFFGRDHQIKEILKRLQQTYFAVVIGGSGSGKSSIVNAGVIPALRKKQLRASGDFWLTACFSPKDRPLRHLAIVLAALVEPRPGQSTEDVVEDVEQTLLETNSLGGFLQRYRARLRLDEGQAPESRENANLLIVCDQFEEIFREQNRDNPETRQLVDLIVEAHRYRDNYPQLYVIIGMRSEDLHRCAEYIDLPNVVNDASFLTRRLNENEIASAIIEPIRLVLRLRGIKPKRYEPIEVDPWPFEVELLRRLNLAVSSLAFNPDHLPLLQHLLSVLWRCVETKPLLQGDATRDTDAAAAFRVTAEDLAAALEFAGIAEADEFASRKKLPKSWILERALDRAAEGVMPTEDRLKRIAGMMFRLLALVNDRGIYTRRWTSRAEIAEVTRDLSVQKPSGLAAHARRLVQRLRGKSTKIDERPASDDEIETVIAAFTSVYPFLNVRKGREGKIDVSHEAFIRNWTMFRGWLNDERSLALAFDALRTAYARWREKLLDPHRRWLGQLSAIFGDHLNGEKLREMRDWWNRRRYNSAWASRYADGVESQEAESERRQPKQISDEMLHSLRSYYARSRGIRYVILAWPWVLSVLGLVAAGLAFEYHERADKSDTQLVAQRISGSVSKKIGDQTQTLDGSDPQARSLILESAGVLDIFQGMQRPKTGLEGLYRRLRGSDDDQGSIAREIGKAYEGARASIAVALWPAVGFSPASADAPGRAKPAPDMRDLTPECQKSTKEYLKRFKADVEALKNKDVRHRLAPLEPPTGRRLVMAQWPDTSLDFLSLSPGPECQVGDISTLTIAPNSTVDFDSDLRLIAVNTKEGEQYRRSWLYRLDWVRRCKDDDSGQTCNVEFYLIVTGTVHDDGPYEVIDASHVKAHGRQYELRRDSDAVLLSELEDVRRARAAFDDAQLARASFVSASAAAARSPVDPSRFRAAVCDRVGPYVALLAGEKDEQRFDTVRIVDGKGSRTCEDYANEPNIIMSFDVHNYSIRSVAFARETRSIVPTDKVPDDIYLQGREDGVIYSLAWKPAKIRSMLCETLRKQAGNDVPSLVSLAHNRSISPDVRMAARRSDVHAQAEICKD